MILNFTKDMLTRSNLYFTNTTNIIIGSILPAFVSDITKLWFSIGAVMIFIGLSIIATKSLIETREKNIQITKARKDLPKKPQDDILVE